MSYDNSKIAGRISIDFEVSLKGKDYPVLVDETKYMTISQVAYGLCAWFDRLVDDFALENIRVVWEIPDIGGSLKEIEEGHIKDIVASMKVNIRSKAIPSDVIVVTVKWGPILRQLKCISDSDDQLKNTGWRTMLNNEPQTILLYILPAIFIRLLNKFKQINIEVTSTFDRLVNKFNMTMRDLNSNYCSLSAENIFATYNKK